MLPAVAFALLVGVAPAVSCADEVKYKIIGVSDPLEANVLSHVQAFSLGRGTGVATGDYQEILDKAIANASAALRPYGYYHPKITGHVTPGDKGDVVVELRIARGEPVRVDKVSVELTGDGAKRSVLKAWRDSWPLGSGAILDQSIWEERKRHALDAADAIGYLAAEYSEHKIDIDLETNLANITLSLDTGPRYVFGDIDFGEHVLKPGVVEYIPRFERGNPYSRKLLEKFRIDLWKTSYFTEVIVEEVHREELSPPTVDLKVVLETDVRNTYQGSLGIGSDTGLRLQGQWSRHPISRNGDLLDIGVGWRELDNAYSIRGLYRLPRQQRAREYWTSDFIINHESEDLYVQQTPDSPSARIAHGQRDERHLRLGRLKVRNFRLGEQQAFETFFLQVLNADHKFDPLDTVPNLLAIVNDPAAGGLLQGTDNTLSIGFDYDLIAFDGKSWETKGYRDRAWVFTANKAFGSDRDFTQFYASTHRSYLKGERFKYLLRAEVGYTDADVASLSVDVGGEPLDLSITSLPNFYRFKAGGSNSVRGYGFEDLSDNQIGSSHIVTASAEVEMKFLQNWSAALFFDIGNAFNDWSDPQLKKGAGFGIRWYSIAGPIRVDVAQALDLADKPWRIHFTIGTPLL